MPDPKLLVEPSYFLHNGIEIEATGGLPLFKFSQSLQIRSDELLQKSKTQSLSQTEQAELDSLTELSQIFTYANSLLAASTLWSPPPSENSSHRERPLDVSTAIPQNS